MGQQAGPAGDSEAFGTAGQPDSANPMIGPVAMSRPLTERARHGAFPDGPVFWGARRCSDGGAPANLPSGPGEAGST